MQTLTDPRSILPRLLFQPVAVDDSGKEIDPAIERAGRRWPSLHPALEVAAELARADSIYEAPAEARELALARLPAEQRFHAISPTPSGLACSCNDWPPTTNAGPGDGRYCADILAYLLALYLQRPLSPLPFTAEELWQTALEELRLQMTRAAFNQWLLGSFAIPEASTPLSLTVAVRNQYAQEWLAHRLHPLIARALRTVAGYEVSVHFITS